MTSYQSDPKLIERLRAVAGKKMTAEQVRAQRVSFVMSTVDTGETYIRADVERALDAREGTAA